MEEMFINTEILYREASAQTAKIKNDPAFIDACIKAVRGTADGRNVIRKMLDCKIKSIVDGIVRRHLAMLAEAESRQSDSIH